MGTGWTRSTAGTARTTRLTATLARADDQGGTQRIVRTETRRRAVCARWERHRAATAHRTGMSTAPSVYRVEHRIGRQCAADLGPLEASSPHHTALTPFVSALRCGGLERHARGRSVSL